MYVTYWKSQNDRKQETSTVARNWAKEEGAEEGASWKGGSVAPLCWQACTHSFINTHILKPKE